MTIKAHGSLPLHLGPAALGGADASAFRVDSDTCSGRTLQPGTTCELTVASRPHRNRVLEADLRIPDDTVRGERVVALAVEGTGEADAMAAIEPAKLYPHPDGYFDELIVSGVRNEPASLDVVVRSQDGGAVVHASALPEATGAFRWTWNGTTESGTMAPAGNYQVVATLTAPPGNQRVVERDISISHAWMEWRNKTVTKPGANYAFFKKATGATISKARSAWPGGVRIDSGTRYVAVGYAFKVEKANAYRWMSFKVLGKSPNRHEAVIAIHDPDLGLPWNLGHYDVARKVGPGYRWWTTGTDGNDRKWNGKTFAAVSTSKGLGRLGPAVFDIRKVKLTYTYGVLHPAPDPAATGGDPQLHDGRDGAEGATLESLLAVGPLPAGVQRTAPPTLGPDPDAAPPPTPTPAPDPEVTPAPGGGVTKTDDPVMDNVAPLADVGGPYVVDEGGLVRLDGRGSADPDGRIVAWAWTHQAPRSPSPSPSPTTTAAVAPPGPWSWSSGHRGRTRWREPDGRSRRSSALGDALVEVAVAGRVAEHVGVGLWVADDTGA